MKIYTRFGDKGQTSLLGGKVVGKENPRVAAYGDVDELNALLGLVIAFGNQDLRETIISIQKDLFTVGAQLAAGESAVKTTILSFDKVEKMEMQIDEIETRLSQLHNFILPGGSKTASLLHVARTVCRRAERSVVALSKNETIDPYIIKYLNRLSDLLFVLARLENRKKRIEEEKWKGSFAISK